MAEVRGQALDALRIAHDVRGRDAPEQGGEIGIGEAIVEGHVGNARQRGAEQRDGRGLAALIEQGDVRAARLAMSVAAARAACRSAPYVQRRPSQTRPMRSGSASAAICSTSEMFIGCQSEEGRGFASLICSATPAIESDPCPAFTHNSSILPSAST